MPPTEPEERAAQPGLEAQSAEASLGSLSSSRMTEQTPKNMEYFVAISASRCGDQGSGTMEMWMDKR